MSTYNMTKEETLELRNIALRRNLLETQVRAEADAITREQVEVERNIEARLGISLRGASMDLSKGIIELKEDAPAQEMVS